MRRAQDLRFAASAVLAGLIGSAGCTHNHYYGSAVPPCAPPAVMSTYHNGDVCEVPSQVYGGTVVAQSPGQTTVISNPVARGSRVLVSQPQGSGRFAWRRPAPEGPLNTRVAGALEDDATIQ